MWQTWVTGTFQDYPSLSLFLILYIKQGLAIISFHEMKKGGLFIKPLHLTPLCSRAIVAEEDDKGKLLAYALSIDQTPFRVDERERCQRCGARVLTMDQIDGYKDPTSQDWGTEEDDGGDPPR